MEKKAKLKIILIIIFSLLITITLLYFLGYRIRKNLTIGHTGKVEVFIPMKDTKVIVDKNKKILTNIDEEMVSLTLSPNKHEIIASKDGYYPWMKNFIVPSSGTLKIYPLFISQNASGEIINNTDNEYWILKQKIKETKLPTKEQMRPSPDKKINMWVENNTILIKEDEKIKVVIQTDTNIRNVEFYKDRPDVIIFSTSNGVFAIETDTKDIQNFMPIYKGVEPNFILNDLGSIYILDNDLLMRVMI